MSRQFDVRRDAAGWTVFDRFTGQVVTINHVGQKALTWLEATDLVRRLQRRTDDGDRKILQ